MQIVELLRAMEDRNASDLFVSVNKRPHYRIMRSLVEADPDTVTDEQFREFLGSHLPAETVERLENNRDLDIGVSLEDSRFRFNIYYQKGELAMVVRRVPSGALSFSELALPTVLTSLAEAPRGLVLVTGSTGSGKSTTMAAMLHHINSSSARHIVTVEDPIEFVHQDLQSVVNQREIGTDTTDFFTSLRHIVRQSPDVIVIGEMRDRWKQVQSRLTLARNRYSSVSTSMCDLSELTIRIPTQAKCPSPSPNQSLRPLVTNRNLGYR